MAKLIAIDGLDGSGKETQSKRLIKYLTEKGKKVRLLSFPTYDGRGSTFVDIYLKGELGKNPEDTNAYAASVFFALDRYYSYRTDWSKDYLDDDTYIIANRYTSANAVHQLSKLPREKWNDFLEWLWDFEFKKIGLPAPDRVIYLEMNPKVSMSLINSRSEQTGRVKDIHEADNTHLTKSYSAALYTSEKLGWDIIHCCDDEGNLRAINDIFADIVNALGL
ncbi:MAG: thymidylate kinase [Ruminococcaceae bacterium]|nr:thymidylate kinase [Oscillospiraceae bacterium]